MKRFVFGWELSRSSLAGIVSRAVGCGVAVCCVSNWMPSKSVHANEPINASEPVGNKTAVGIDESPMPVHVERAFPEVRIDRPILLMHAGDGSGRFFVGSQHGQIYFLSDENQSEPTLFMDLSEQVTYKDNQNEEGLLGLAFHPQFRENGEFFLYYTSSDEAQLSRISRFRTVPGNPNAGDRASEEILLEMKQPYWNHNGGTLVFGPDGFLYVGLGDGGFRADPLRAGQDLSTLLGKILRIDVDRRDPGMKYAIPEDNPFVNTPGARPEVFAYGLRNVWRMSFDRQTGDFYVADVGQDLWEEVNLVTRGGNYGWSLREAAHPFYQKTEEAPAELIDPIWEYPHTEEWGKSITGGNVYRGSRLPELQGYYLYADYVTGRLWALQYDRQLEKVTANRPIAWGPSLPVVSFGETESGDVYFSTVTAGGVIYRFAAGAE